VAKSATLELGFKMKKFKQKLFLITALLGLILGILPMDEAFAQISSVGIATYREVTGSKVENGDIIITSENGYKISNKAYDVKIVGVATLNPGITLRSDGKKDGVPVISSGTAYVKVTGTNGNIKKGDFITSSDTPGTGMKAIKSGMILGEALEGTNFTKKEDIKLLPVAINPHTTSLGTQPGNFFMDLFKLSSESAAEQPSQALKYLVAGIITIITFGSGFLIFARTVNTGLEALGRNPLAGRQIQFSIIFNIIMIIVIIIAGTGLAYFVIRL
jgi:hypothetical protein